SYGPSDSAFKLAYVIGTKCLSPAQIFGVSLIIALASLSRQGYPGESCRHGPSDEFCMTTKERSSPAFSCILLVRSHRRTSKMLPFRHEERRLSGFLHGILTMCRKETLNDDKARDRMNTLPQSDWLTASEGAAYLKVKPRSLL